MTRSPTVTAGFDDTEIAYDRNSNPTSTKNPVRGSVVAGLRQRDVLHTLDGLNRVNGAEQTHLSSGTIGYPYGLGQRITWRYDADANGTVASTE